MKAWIAREKDGFSAAVVFAETRGKARALARNTDACEDCDWCDIEVYRLPKIDKYYKEGKKEMDWCDPKDRIILVKECGFRCEIINDDECEECAAKEYCDLYKDYVEELRE
ncbi:MAG: hypothetical protein IJ308_04325 [Clostridia bacterium]|nr:hypothetical protein [Clostridia bacterium]